MFKVGDAVWVCQDDEAESDWSAGTIKYIDKGLVGVAIPGQEGVCYDVGLCRNVFGVDPILPRDPALNGKDRPE